MLTTLKYSHLSSLYNSPTRFYHNLNHVNHLLGLLSSKFDQLSAPLLACGVSKEVIFSVLQDAIWYHDIYYNPYVSNGSNEERSMEMYALDVPSSGYSTYLEPDSNKAVVHATNASYVLFCILTTAYHTEGYRECEGNWKPNLAETWDNFIERAFGHYYESEFLSASLKGISNRYQIAGLFADTMCDLDLAGLADSTSAYFLSSFQLLSEVEPKLIRLPKTQAFETFVNGRTHFLNSLLTRPTIFYTPAMLYLEYHARSNIYQEITLLEELSRNGGDLQSVKDAYVNLYLGEEE